MGNSWPESTENMPALFGTRLPGQETSGWGWHLLRGEIMTELKVTLGTGKDAAEYLFRRLADGKGWWSAWKLNTPVMHIIDTRGGKCDCPGYKYSKPADKGCRHLSKALELESKMSDYAGTDYADPLVVPKTNGEAMQLQDKRAEMAQIITRGNLAMMSETEKATYYLNVCAACDLNPATRPFEFINLKGKLVLYALRSCADQLRKRDCVSVEVISQELNDGTYIVTVKASMPNGRSDTDLAAVVLGTTIGEERANLIMKTITKAKRRVTLSICGLGMLDETEVEQFQPVVTAGPAKTVSLPEFAPGTPAAERQEVEKDIMRLVDELGLAMHFAPGLQQKYGKRNLSELTVEQIADCQQRLIAKKQTTKGAA